MTKIDETLEKLRGVLSIERERSSNGLAEIAASKLRRAAIVAALAEIEAELEPIRKAANTLPLLPDESEIAWAQAVLAMRVCSLKIDTTGLTPDDEIVRVAVVNGQEQVTLDLLVKPTRRLSAGASVANGLTDTDLANAPALSEVWEQIRAALVGRYVLVFSPDFDEKLLNAEAKRHDLVPIIFVGDSIQHHATYYYNREYFLTLEDLCQRMGHPLMSRNAVDRARGQLAVVQEMAEGVTDVRPRAAKQEAISPASSILHEAGDAALGDIDEHPF